MFVLGIDPGLSRCGYGLVRSSAEALSTGARDARSVSAPRALHIEAAGVITTDRQLSVQRRLAELFGELESLVCEFEPEVVVVERLFFQTNARTAVSIGQAGGLALVVADRAGCEVAQYSANEVKQVVAGYGAATKRQVQEMVARLLGLQAVPSPPDVADALGLAICHLTRAPMAAAVEAASRCKSALAGAGLAGGLL